MCHVTSLFTPKSKVSVKCFSQVTKNPKSKSVKHSVKARTRKDRLTVSLIIMMLFGPVEAVLGYRPVPVVHTMSVFPLVAFVVVQVSRGVVALAAGVRLLTSVSQHVSLQVHALVARVAANVTVERLGARMDALMAPQVVQVATGVATRWALVWLLARVHTQVPFEVVQVGGGIGALWTVVRFLLRVDVGMAG